MITEEQLQNERNLIFLELWGSTSHTLKPWEGYAAAETNYAPEWLTYDDLTCDPDDCTTVLSYGFSEVEPPEGYRVAYSYCAGEKECPWCEAKGVLPEEAGDRAGEKCDLCDGDGYLYEGEDCQVVVFAPRYNYSCGKRYGGKGSACDLESAIDAIAEEHSFGDLSDATWERVANDLRTKGSHHFDRRLVPFVGSEKCEVTDMGDS